MSGSSRLSAERHGDGLLRGVERRRCRQRFRWLLRLSRPKAAPRFQPWLEKVEASEDPLFFAVIDKASGKIAGRQTLMRIDPAFGVIEIGNIYWGPLISRKPAATEAQFLFTKYAFDELGYRRYEWKCNNRNEPSKRAAERFGFKFEGIFRQHLVVKGENRDTAWYSIIDKEWPALSMAYEAWLDPANFDGEGRQKRRLEEFRADLACNRIFRDWRTTMIMIPARTPRSGHGGTAMRSRPCPRRDRQEARPDRGLPDRRLHGGRGGRRRADRFAGAAGGCRPHADRFGGAGACLVRLPSRRPAGDRAA